MKYLSFNQVCAQHIRAARQHALGTKGAERAAKVFEYFQEFLGVSRGTIPSLAAEVALQQHGYVHPIFSGVWRFAGIVGGVSFNDSQVNRYVRKDGTAPILVVLEIDGMEEDTTALVFDNEEAYQNWLVFLQKDGFMLAYSAIKCLAQVL